MNIRIKATKIKLTPQISEYIQKKMDMLEKYLGKTPVQNCDFEIGLTVGGQNSGKIYKAEANLALPGELIRIEKSEKELIKAIDKVKDHLSRSIKKYKEKRIKK